LRDANNLAWKLDLVLRGIAPDTLLVTYTSERRHQNEAVVGSSMEMGKMSCVLDAAAAVGRDAAFRSGQVPPPPQRPGIGDGVLRHPVDGNDPVAGWPAVQGRVAGSWGTGLTDEVVGAGFAVICAVGDPQQLLDHDRLEFLDLIGAHLFTLDSSIPGALRDVDGALSGWLVEHRLVAVISRPDFYAFGGVPHLSQLPELIDDLRQQLLLTTIVA
jgi:hypothetical protein